MDWSILGFKAIYKASCILLNLPINSTTGVPGLFSVLMNMAPAASYPISPTTIAGVAACRVELGFHSGHALVLFLVIRAQLKYRGQKTQLDVMQDKMDKLTTAINYALNEVGRAPAMLPSTGIPALFNPTANAQYTSLLNEAIAHTRAFVMLQDIVLEDIARCTKEWNSFLLQNSTFLNTTKPRNLFESISQYGVNRSREFAELEYVTELQSAINSLTDNRNDWARLLGLRPVAPILQLNF